MGASLGIDAGLSPFQDLPIGILGKQILLLVASKMSLKK